MLTKKDIANLVKELSGTFATKDELKEEIRGVREDLSNTVLQFKDDILYEIKGIREEMTILTGYRDKIVDHEERIEKLEDQSTSKDGKSFVN